ncbi:DUF3157 family protein [Vibrio sp. TRT 21S02]|uniref:DUF3157 family protein n=1 Tax=Vibrio sp. TRT 21S02 TaxID=3418507 RepID=UPI003CF98A83
MKKWLILGTWFASQCVLASQIVTLADGRQVQLNDDFTWQYIHAASASSGKETSQVAAIPPVSIITNTTLVTVGSERNTMQLSDSGVDVLLGAARYEDGELHIPTSLTNQSSSSVIFVAVEVTLMSADGYPLATETVPVWKSIKRMADTYLRPQQSKQGQVIKLPVKNAEQFKLSARIIEVITR